MKEGKLEEINEMLQNKYKEIQAKETLLDKFMVEEVEIVLVAFGSMARIAKKVVTDARKAGFKVGLIRPISLWPFGYKQIASLTKKAKAILVVEINMGQMLEDVKLAVGDKVPVHFYGRAGGGIPTEEEILKRIKNLANKK